MYDPLSAGWPAQLTATAFDRLGQYASSPGSKSTVMQNSLFSSLAVVNVIPLPVLILLTHGGIARLSWPGWLIKYQGGVNVT